MDARSEFSDIGEMWVIVEENPNCVRSENTGWHLARGKGQMSLQVTAKTEDLREQTIIRAMLVRSNPVFTNLPVSGICDKHSHESHADLVEHVLQPVTGQEKGCKMNNDGVRRSITFPTQQTNKKLGLTITNITLKVLCNDSCRTNDNDGRKIPQRGRDQRLVLSLENMSGIIRARTSLQIWPKAVILKRDLNKEIRRGPQGGARQKEDRMNKQNFPPWQFAQIQLNLGRVIMEAKKIHMDKELFIQETTRIWSQGPTLRKGEWGGIDDEII